MYGVEAAVVLVVVGVTVLALWTSPLWVRVLARLFRVLGRQFDRTSNTIDHLLGRDVEDSNALAGDREDVDRFPREER
jgi:hypothetical protein